MRSFSNYKARFNDLYDAIEKNHQGEGGNRGHGIDHDIAVAQTAALISPDERIAEKSWVASIIHSTDRFIRNLQLNDELLERERLEERLRELLSLLPKGYFTNKEIDEIYTAALRHEEKNQNDQGIVQQVLQDADRLANLDLLVTIRIGQFRPTIKAIDLEYVDKVDPSSTYSQPKSALDAVRINLSEYIPQFRLPAAIKIAQEREGELLDYISKVEKSYKNLLLG